MITESFQKQPTHCIWKHIPVFINSQTLLLLFRLVFVGNIWSHLFTIKVIVYINKVPNSMMHQNQIKYLDLKIFTLDLILHSVLSKNIATGTVCGM